MVWRYSSSGRKSFDLEIFLDGFGKCMERFSETEPFPGLCSTQMVPSMAPRESGLTGGAAEMFKLKITRFKYKI